MLIFQRHFFLNASYDYLKVLRFKNTDNALNIKFDNRGQL